MHTFQEVTNQEVQNIVTPLLTPLLEPLGFEPQKLLYWIRSDGAPIRQIFSLSKWKGGRIAPTWGVSMDFVPHLSGKKLKWHRTKKSAIYDIRYDARDSDLDMKYCRGPKYKKY